MKFIAAYLALAAFTLPAAAQAQSPTQPPEPPHPRNRAEATDVVRALRRIVTPNGIEEAKTIRIGGIDQFVTIRGKDRRNPVLLVLHGGPGYVETPLSWWYAHDWEDYFTVVEWDQRGAGKTYLLNDPKAVAPTMTPQRMNADVDEMVQTLRKDLGKRKIFVIGHSWGSYLGLELAKRHPEWLYAYIGVGQAASAPESERRGYAFALAAAEKAHDEKAIAELKAIAPYPRPGAPISAIATSHRWVDHFGGVMAYRHDQEDESHAARLSPDYTDAEAPHVYDGNEFSEDKLLAFVLGMDLSGEKDFKCPILLFEGRFDRTVNSDVAYEWLQTVHAPLKRFVWFEHSAHEPMTEEPGKFLVSLVRDARPLAAKAGDVAPE
ncbi:MAG: alpha/beta fold hydrolase [Proteobacteria bacterium]|nr:alpha/beta fold hydrolase [Pseudomonadota bacterium]